MASSSWNSNRNAHQIANNFENSKNQCLGKRDKSSAGRIDPRAVNICSVLNAYPVFYTTSSCAGRCYLYRGQGIKATHSFRRYRVSHEKVVDAKQYFDLATLNDDDDEEAPVQQAIGDTDDDVTFNSIAAAAATNDSSSDNVLWLRYEPFILHVACRSLAAAGALMAAARPFFKNVGVTTWKEDTSGKYIVLILGDESLEMPLTTLQGDSLVESFTTEWLAELVNERHDRNWRKIEGFVDLARNITVEDDSADIAYPTEDFTMISHQEDANDTMAAAAAPRSFDVIGDVAVINSLDVVDKNERQRVGELIMKKNKAIKLVVARDSTLKEAERAPGSEGMTFIAGLRRSPLITTHCEYGIKCVVDLEHTFFTPRMAQERLRICQQVSRGENVLVLFSGVGMEAFHIVARTEASSVLAIDMNSYAAECARRGMRMLERKQECQS